jgi:hypothetical protein
MDAQVKRRKKATKNDAALIFSSNLYGYILLLHKTSQQL